MTHTHGTTVVEERDSSATGLVIGIVIAAVVVFMVWMFMWGPWSSRDVGHNNPNVPTVEHRDTTIENNNNPPASTAPTSAPSGNPSP